MKFRNYLAALLAIAILLCGCARENTGETQPLSQATEPISETSTLPEPTEEITQPATVETQPTQPEEILHSGIREDGSFDGGTLFIGDSQTYGMVTDYLPSMQLLGDARYMAIPGASPLAYFLGPILNHNSIECAYSPEFEGMLISEGVAAAGESITAIYFMMGSNFTDYVTVDTYIGILEHMLSCCPNATIYLQIIPYSTSYGVRAAEATECILESYEYFADNPRVMLVDTQSAIGYDGLNSRGVHLTKEGQARWYHALVSFAQENQIPQ